MNIGIAIYIVFLYELSRQQGTWKCMTMWSKGGWLIILLTGIFLVVPVLGDSPIPDHIQCVVDHQGLVANGMDTTGVTITIYDFGSNPISYVPVDFILADPNMGQFSPSSVTTTAAGAAETTFRAGKKDGHAQFSVRVQYVENGTVKYRDFSCGEKIWIQNPIPDTIFFNTTKEWLIANGTDSHYARVLVLNKTYPIPGIGVSFQVLEDNMGYFQTPAPLLTDDQGTAQMRFTTKYKSGNATLKAFISYLWEGNETVIEKQLIQKIDHDNPYELSSYTVPSEISVGLTIPIVMVYRDRWGNPVDNRRITEYVTFKVSSPQNDALFTESNSSVATIPVNLFGEARATLQVSKTPAIDVLYVDPDMGTIPDKYFFIQCIANRTPVRIAQTFVPAATAFTPPKLYADGVNSFSITYTVLDEFSNGVMNSPVKVEVFDVATGNLVEEQTLFSNSFGQVLLSFGPKSTIGKYKLRAQAIGNTTSPPTCEQEVWFVSQEAQDIQLTVIPDTMASGDVEGWEPALVMAKVIDENGNPVEGETVTFTLGTPIYDTDIRAVTKPPELSTNTSISDSDGFAIVDFIPGNFTTNWTLPYYDDTATGRCMVIAHWENITRGKSATKSVEVTWKNYPYLSIETFVYPQTVNVTDNVSVMIRLKGDGWALRPKPIDAVLCTDRSGSMLKDNPDRMVSVMEASKAFVNAMHVGPTRDHIGLVSFGTNGWAKLAPGYRYLNEKYYCYKPDYPNAGWDTRRLTGWFYDWTNVYGVTSDSNRISSSSFKWVYQDDNWDMPTSPSYYWYQRYWPYTENYDTSSAHQVYVTTHYPGNNRNYGQYAVIENSLSDNPALIETSISRMVPSGGTPMRYGLYRAINEIIANGRSNAIRAIILLSDGDYNWYGDPLARGTGSDSCNPTSYDDLSSNYCKFSGLGVGINSNQNMSNYARNNNIRIYSIGFADEITAGGKLALRTLAESTGGQYFDGNAANIDEIYTIIAGKLQEEAGVNTTMRMGYDQLEVNYEIITINETYRVFEYIPETAVDSYFQNMSRPDHDPPYPYSTDQSAEFNTNHTLNFNVGTIKLGQTWEAIYKLKVITDGTINIFGPNSKVYFNGTQGQQDLLLPKTYITGVKNMTSQGVNASTLEISVGDSSESETNIVTWPIFHEYTGVNEVKEDYYISIDGGQTWILVASKILSPEEANKPGFFSVNRNQFPPGSNIVFRVVANALDAPGPVIEASLPSPPPPAARKAYIILK